MRVSGFRQDDIRGRPGYDDGSDDIKRAAISNALYAIFEFLQ